MKFKVIMKATKAMTAMKAMKAMKTTQETKLKMTIMTTENDFLEKMIKLAVKIKIQYWTKKNQ